jgi:hypothetical protein
LQDLWIRCHGGEWNRLWWTLPRIWKVSRDESQSVMRNCSSERTDPKFPRRINGTFYKQHFYASKHKQKFYIWLLSCCHVTVSCYRWHVTTSCDRCHVTASCDHCLPTASCDRCHVTALCDVWKSGTGSV